MFYNRFYSDKEIQRGSWPKEEYLRDEVTFTMYKLLK